MHVVPGCAHDSDFSYFACLFHPDLVAIGGHGCSRWGMSLEQFCIKVCTYSTTRATCSSVPHWSPSINEDNLGRQDKLSAALC